MTWRIVTALVCGLLFSARAEACMPGEDMSYDRHPELAHIELTVVQGGGKKGLAVSTIAEGKAPFVYGPALYGALMHKQVDLDGRAGVAVFRFRNIDLPSALSYVGNHARCGGVAPVTLDPDAKGWVDVRVPFRWHTSVLIPESLLAKARGKYPLACVTVEFADESGLDYLPKLVGNSSAWPDNTSCAPPTAGGETALPTLRPGNQAYRFLVVTKANAARGGA